MPSGWLNKARFPPPAGAFLFRDRIKALVGGSNKSPNGQTKNFFGSGREDCPTCEGTGYATCACTKWSNDGEGCGTCNYTCRTICPSCRGGGKGVRATLDLKIDDEETDRENMRRQRERDTHSWKAWNNSSAKSKRSSAMTTTMNPLTTPLICLPVVSAPESNESGGRRSASSSDNGDRSSNQNKKNQTTSSTRSRAKPFVPCAKTIRFSIKRTTVFDIQGRRWISRRDVYFWTKPRSRQLDRRRRRIRHGQRFESL